MKINAQAIKRKLGWVGHISIRENGRYQRSRTAPTVRRDRDEALKDAQELARELQEAYSL